MTPPPFPLMKFEYFKTNGITLHAARAGPKDGPLVILLHGFPEFWYGWRHQIGPLATAGFDVIALDQRGYNLSDKPAGVASYDLDLLSDDVAGVADAVGRKSFSIVGHDWGGIVGYWMAGRLADRLERMAILNAAHPSVWREAIAGDTEQRRKSWYVKLFQVPRLPEWGMRFRRFRGMAKALQSDAKPGAFTDDDLHLYRGAWEQPGALTAMVNWYRAVARKPLPAAKTVRIEVPTLILWGRNDRYAIAALAERTQALCANATLQYFDNATHWVQHDEPNGVSAALIDFLRDTNQTASV